MEETPLSILRRNQGKPLAAERVQNCRWINPQNPLQTTPEGWPLQPILEPLSEFQSLPKERGAPLLYTTVTWSQISPNGSKTILEERTVNLLTGLLWPGGEEYNTLTPLLLGKHPEARSRPVERIAAYKLLQNLTEEATHPEILTEVKKLRGIKKYTALQFLLQDLPPKGEELNNTVRNRNQFLKKSPELVHWIWNTAYKMGTKETQKTLLRLVDSGAKESEIAATFFDPSWNIKQLRTLAKVIQGNKKQIEDWTRELNKRTVSPRVNGDTSHDLEKKNQRLCDKIEEILKKGKASRCLPPEGKSFWQFNQSTNEREKGDQLFLWMLQWKAQREAVGLRKTLEKRENQKPEELRHPITLPDTEHIIDFFEDTYKDSPLPENRSLIKLYDRIRRWDNQTLSQAEEELLKADVPIPPQVLQKFPTTIKGETFSGSLLRSKHDYERESARMTHCVRSYFHKGESGAIAVYHLTDSEKKEWTLEVNPSLHLLQLKGPKNLVPPSAFYKSVRTTLQKAKEAQEPDFPDISPIERRTFDRLQQKGWIIVRKAEESQELADLEKQANDAGQPEIIQKVREKITGNPKSYLASQNGDILILTANQNTPIIEEWKEETLEFAEKRKEPTAQERTFEEKGKTWTLHPNPTGKSLLTTPDGETILLGKTTWPEAEILDQPNISKSLKIEMGLYLLLHRLEKEKAQKTTYRLAQSLEDCKTTPLDQLPCLTVSNKNEKLAKAYAQEVPLHQTATSQNKILLRIEEDAQSPEEKALITKLLNLGKKEKNYALYPPIRDIQEALEKTQKKTLRIAVTTPKNHPGKIQPEFCWVRSEIVLGTAPQKAPKKPELQPEPEPILFV